jgi:hypothetical protein
MNHKREKNGINIHETLERHVIAPYLIFIALALTSHSSLLKQGLDNLSTGSVLHFCPSGPSYSTSATVVHEQ